MELHIFQNKRSHRIETCITIIINADNLASYTKHIPKNIYHSFIKVTFEVSLLRYLTHLSVTFDEYIIS